MMKHIATQYNEAGTEDFEAMHRAEHEELSALRTKLNELMKEVSGSKEKAIIDFADRLIHYFAQNAERVLRQQTLDSEMPLQRVTWQRMFDFTHYERVRYEELITLIGSQGSSETIRQTSVAEATVKI